MSDAPQFRLPLQRAKAVCDFCNAPLKRPAHQILSRTPLIRACKRCRRVLCRHWPRDEARRLSEKFALLCEAFHADEE
jgi:hypothetical protein